MKAQTVAAQFAAYVWFEHNHISASEEEKSRFAKANWQAFVPIVPAGLGRLLLKISAGRSSRSGKSRPSYGPKLMAIG
jgi:hypothetical protein